jgi:hypothetical protein
VALLSWFLRCQLLAASSLLGVLFHVEAWAFTSKHERASSVDR